MRDAESGSGGGRKSSGGFHSVEAQVASADRVQDLVRGRTVSWGVCVIGIMGRARISVRMLVAWCWLRGVGCVVLVAGTRSRGGFCSELAGARTRKELRAVTYTFTSTHPGPHSLHL